MNFNESSDFKREAKALHKKIPSLKSDLERAKVTIESLIIKPAGLSADEWSRYKESFFDGKRATKLGGYPPDFDVVKLRLDTDTVQYSGKLRLVICVAIGQDGEATLVEIFSKSNKNREDTTLIKRTLRNLS